jgi:CRISPR-associated protein Cas2
MLYLVAYDVSDDKVRLRMSNVLLRFGERVQESVFECRVTRPQLNQMVEECGIELKRDPEGQMRVYPVCQTCAAAAFGIGQISRARLTGPAIVI